MTRLLVGLLGVASVMVGYVVLWNWIRQHTQSDLADRWSWNRVAADAVIGLAFGVVLCSVMIWVNEEAWREDLKTSLRLVAEATQLARTANQALQDTQQVLTTFQPEFTSLLDEFHVYQEAADPETKWRAAILQRLHALERSPPKNP